MPQDVPVIVARLPRRFYEDHQDRELPSGSPKRWLKRQVDVELTLDEFYELLSDARHYADPVGFDAWVVKELTPSAKRTVAVLERYGSLDFHPRGDA